MAARKNLSHSDRTRAKIKTSMLVNRLTNFVEGKCQLSAAQVTAALGLMKKVVPDLAAISVDGNVDVTGTLKHTVDYTRMSEDELRRSAG